MMNCLANKRFYFLYSVCFYHEINDDIFSMRYLFRHFAVCVCVCVGQAGNWTKQSIKKLSTNQPTHIPIYSK